MRSAIATIPSFLVLISAAFIAGCRGSTTEVRLGPSVHVGVHRAASGRVAVDVKVGNRTCETPSVAVAWEGGAARIDDC